MVSTILKSSISSIRLSTVVPAEVTGDHQDHELTNMDLALKLHYIRGVYFFESEAVQDLTIYDLKKPMFSWLVPFHITAGRVRLSENGRPFVKCNDSGVRIIEAYCDRTIDEWLRMKDHQSLYDFLVSDQVLGPDLGFSPLVFIQFTWFKCGGMALGLNWAHVLGDPLSASAYLNVWGRIMQGHVPIKSLHVPKPGGSEHPPSTPSKPFSVKQVDLVGDHWVTPGTRNMATLSFHLSSQKLDDILSNTCGLNHRASISHFEVISAMIWKCLAKVRDDSGPRIVTICTGNSRDGEHEAPSNQMAFRVVRADFAVAKGEISELVVLIAEKQEEENSLIEEMVDRHNGKLDCMVYGANLTFVNLEGADIYGLKLRGKKPVFASYSINGVGDGGAVIVFSGPDNGRTVTVTLPENQVAELMNELRKDWVIV